MFKMLMPLVFTLVLVIVWYITKSVSFSCMCAVVSSRMMMTVKRRDNSSGYTLWSGAPENVLESRSFNYLNSALIRSVIMLFVMFYVPLCHFTLQYFNCEREPDGTWALDAQPSLKCYDDQHLKYLPWSTFGFLMYMIGIPVMVSVILRKNRENVRIYNCIFVHLFSCLKIITFQDSDFWSRDSTQITTFGNENLDVVFIF